MSWWAKRQCFHHDWTTGESWIVSVLLDAGRRKMFGCTHCRKLWFTK